MPPPPPGPLPAPQNQRAQASRKAGNQTSKGKMTTDRLNHWRRATDIHGRRGPAPGQSDNIGILAGPRCQTGKPVRRLPLALLPVQHQVLLRVLHLGLSLFLCQPLVLLRGRHQVLLQVLLRGLLQVLHQVPVRRLAPLDQAPVREPVLDQAPVQGPVLARALAPVQEPLLVLLALALLVAPGPVRETRQVPVMVLGRPVVMAESAQQVGAAAVLRARQSLEVRSQGARNASRATHRCRRVRMSARSPHHRDGRGQQNRRSGRRNRRSRS